MAAEEPGDGDDQADDDPLGDLADRVRARREGVDAGLEPEAPADDDAFGLDQYFQEETYEDVDADDLWETLETEEETPSGVEVADEPNEHIVPKRSYCESCPKDAFSEPPEVSCSHPGTTIVEYADTDHVLVRNCPVVAERQALGEEDQSPMTPGSFGSQGQG